MAAALSLACLPIRAQSPQDGQLQALVAAQQSAMQSGDSNAILHTSDGLGAFTLRLLARFETQSGDLTRASDYYAQSLAIEDNPATRLALANSFLLRKDAPRALAEASNVTAAHPDDPAGWQITGEALQLKNDPAGAADAFARAFTLAPAPQTAVLLASAALTLHQLDRTARAFAQIAQSMGENAGLHLLFANAYHQAGDLVGTIRELNKALALDPNLGPVHLALGNAYWELNEYQYNADSLREFTAAQRLAPADYFANYDLGSVESQYHLFADAAKHFALAAEADPAAPDPWLALGMNAYSENDWTAARTDLGKAVTLTGAQESRDDYSIRRAYLVLSRLETQDGNAARAADLSARAERLRRQMLANGSRPALSESTGMVVTNSPAAARQFSVAEHESPPASSADSSQLQAAEKQLREIAATSLNDAGTALARAHDYAGALPRFRAAAQANPELSPVLRNLGLAAFHTGAYQESVTALTRALAQDPADSLASHYLQAAQSALQTGAIPAKPAVP